jgi:hypothetical protein
VLFPRHAAILTVRLSTSLADPRMESSSSARSPSRYRMSLETSAPTPHGGHPTTSSDSSVWWWHVCWHRVNGKARLCNGFDPRCTARWCKDLACHPWPQVGSSVRLCFWPDMDVPRAEVHAAWRETTSRTFENPLAEVGRWLAVPKRTAAHQRAASMLLRRVRFEGCGQPPPA